MEKTIIKGTGRYLPPRLVTNDTLTQWMDTSSDWILQRTGIEQRYWVPEQGGVGSSDLGFEAAKIAMERSGWKADDIDLIIFATLSPDLFFPGSGCLLAHKLGLTSTPALDIRQQCTGFLYGMTTADAYIRSGLAKRILLVGAEVHSTGLDISTRGRDVAVIFGDGAAAVCLERMETDDKAGILAACMHADGSLAESLMTFAPASRENPRLDAKMLAEGRHFPTMDGKNIFKNAVRRLPEVAGEVLKKTGMPLEAVDLFIPHQANLRINQAFAKAMDIPESKIYNNIQRYGNTTAASIPLALDEAIEKGVVGAGSTVMFLGLGAGVTWGAVLYRFGV
ncbi:3-oxoacyl-ACP synthase III family protein [Desulfosarcina sp.]|uniref:3-oxoacyl-ACP synthase III family protein n=1 Tax=Desulfosarcina sp. TaxID=2027861 RepID=UPI003970D13B